MISSDGSYNSTDSSVYTTSNASWHAFFVCSKAADQTRAWSCIMWLLVVQDLHNTITLHCLDTGLQVRQGFTQ